MRRVFILGGKVGHVTRHAGQLFKVKRSKVKVTRSRAVSADKNAITRQWILHSCKVLRRRPWPRSRRAPGGGRRRTLSDSSGVRGRTTGDCRREVDSSVWPYEAIIQQLAWNSSYNSAPWSTIIEELTQW